MAVSDVMAAACLSAASASAIKLDSPRRADSWTSAANFKRDTRWRHTGRTEDWVGDSRALLVGCATGSSDRDAIRSQLPASVIEQALERHASGGTNAAELPHGNS